LVIATDEWLKSDSSEIWSDKLKLLHVKHTEPQSWQS